MVEPPCGLALRVITTGAAWIDMPLRVSDFSRRLE
jgi:hypothetical protein